ncbi:MAG: hypothetical protein D084_Lepto4C00406G0001 [Leptospirillum sp. Group IV 'UBA BS']|nr:MAG: hypothetical protein D084_Lepto4C00406G0001 [Leptospirillum sp. Group IV 'UBA BS']
MIVEEKDIDAAALRNIFLQKLLALGGGGHLLRESQRLPRKKRCGRGRDHFPVGTNDPDDARPPLPLARQTRETVERGHRRNIFENGQPVGKCRPLFGVFEDPTHDGGHSPLFPTFRVGRDLFDPARRDLLFVPGILFKIDGKESADLESRNPGISLDDLVDRGPFFEVGGGRVPLVEDDPDGGRVIAGRRKGDPQDRARLALGLFKPRHLIHTIRMKRHLGPLF